MKKDFVESPKKESVESPSKNMDEAASYQRSSETLRLCARGCGFYGSPATHNLCSKCYRNYLKELETVSSANSSVALIDGRDPSVLDPCENSSPCLNAVAESETPLENNNIPSNKKRRCLCCNKKVGLLGFACRCGGTFCGVHRYPEEHDCKSDYKSAGRVAIADQNPLVKADKLESRI